MRCEFPIMAVRDPFAAVRRDFERQMQNKAHRNAMPLTIQESENRVEIAFDIPGVPEDKIEIVIHEGCLQVSGERAVNIPEGASVVFNNRSVGSFQRSLKLDDSIDPDSVDAVLSNGVLTVTMKRRPELQPKKVAIRPAT